MSFILDALKKLERQKQIEEPSQPGDQTVMVGGRRWGDERTGVSFRWGSAIVAVAALVVAGLALYRSLTPSTATTNDALPPAAEISPPESTAPDAPAAGTQSKDVIEPEAENPLGAPRKTSPPASPVQGGNEGDPADPRNREDLEESELDVVETAPPVRLTGNTKAERVPERANEEPDVSTSDVPEGLPELVLQGTAVVDGKAVAVVNYQRLFEGDTIEGATVIRITDRSVELEYEGKKFTLTF